MEYIAFIFKAGEDYVGIVPDVSDNVAYGDDFDEVCEALEDFIELSLEDEDLPNANKIEYFTQEVLQNYAIPLDCKHYIVNVQNDGEKSYEVSLILD